LVAIIVALAFLLTGCGEKQLLTSVSFDRESITPNADGDTDVLKITYGLSRSATVSITFEDKTGSRYTFRDHARRGPSVEKAYEVLFAGVVDGYTLPGEAFEQFEMRKRVLQDGDYVWTVEATDDTGHTERVTGTLTIEGADTALPELRNFSVSPIRFTPNRDGISDRAKINVSLSKDDTSLVVYLLDEAGTRYPVEKDEQTLAREGKAGLYAFDYDAGVDDGAQPPPDGTYTVYAEAEDAVGQRTLARTTLTIQDGGVPMAYIFNGEVEWSSRSVPLGETLTFTLTVDNDSPAPIRTSGPPPGTVYANDQNYATLGEYIQSGVFRVGIHCENATTNYPWRWAVGDDSVLEERDGHLYLPPFTRAVVSGGIRFVDVVGARNPQYCWAGLIHEDVQISPVNDRVDPVSLLIEVP
jgi:major membrane immunogen (membrane-anchored lipoprotein)